MSASQNPVSPPPRGPTGCVTASHEVLYEAGPASCDVCGDDLSEPEPDSGFDVRGSGLYIWTRGDEVRYEEPPLCASCASAIGLSALLRWEIEEEEG